jgi:hypothetical protein
MKKVLISRQPLFSFYCICKAFTVGFVLLLPFSLLAQGDLLVTPRRIVFEGNKQREEITLANTGQDSAFYSISFLQYHMTKDGSFEEITEPEPGQLFADSFLRFFPRSVQLAPGESQIVRMQVRRAPDMMDGEYRSHLYFRAVPEVKPLGEKELLTDSTSIGVRLTPIFGISIPVIIRVGSLSSQIVLSDLSVEQEEDKPPMLKVTLNRKGNRSVYGDLEATYLNTEGEKAQVGSVRGIAIYTPNTLRRFSMPLNFPEGSNIATGKLLVRYSSSNEAKPEIFDEKELELN